jgi:hypothetical protein
MDPGRKEGKGTGKRNDEFLDFLLEIAPFH